MPPISSRARQLKKAHEMQAKIREPPQNWLTVSTLRTWHQDISKLHIDTQTHQAINALSFGTLVDKSTRDEAKNFFLCYQFWNQKDQIPVVNVAHREDISNCNANTLSDTIIKYIQQDGLDFIKCAL
ncbi:11149_t:CDS:2 [Funneliformis caledonium]|uniref:11149_t:CDS:1 n=1 Tax=Funneliformis caledonium TaxID=1117310 RepID=A0A9N8Z0T0_9GLOM|nr:11149_t:CDS:2 [Funneliformis caledonium]